MIKLEKLAEMRALLYKIVINNDNIDSMAELYNKIKDHDKDLAETLILLISEMDTQIKLNRNHFIEVIDKFIAMEEQLIRHHYLDKINNKINNKDQKEKNTFFNPIHLIEIAIEYKIVITIILLAIAMMTPLGTHILTIIKELTKII